MLQNYVTSILSTCFSLFLMGKVFAFWGRSEWGKLVTCLLGAAICAYCIFKPQAAIAILTNLGTLLVSVFQ
ncbi:hypothetical protein ACIBUR_28605 [Streptomyces anulatus]|uniref:hypothetical protein n=1 Tax=Streptomyces microflavus TaxID=1919 RepID=UPI0037B8865E